MNGIELRVNNVQTMGKAYEYNRPSLQKEANNNDDVNHEKWN
jgi:hypothetical protein